VNLLLDTQALLWWRAANRRLGRRARQAIEGGAATVCVSAASIWEMAIKSAIGKLRLRDSLAAWVPDVLEQHGFRMLNVTVVHAAAVAGLPHHHADPFDRLLIAQAHLEQLVIVTSDTAFDHYDVKTLDSRI
jgi:PIN domain nuclease of toxin-antitoxin system